MADKQDYLGGQKKKSRGQLEDYIKDIYNKGAPKKRHRYLQKEKKEHQDGRRPPIFQDKVFHIFPAS